MVSIRLQRDKRPPAWLEDFITGGELEQSLAIQPKTETLAAHSVKMAQRQLKHPPAINIQDMWDLSDDEERRERRLPGGGLDISWLTDSTRADITDLFYYSTAQEGKCAVESCNYSTLNRRKLLDHLVTHRIVYSTVCQYITSRRDSAVKHLRICHNHKGSITQVDADS